MYYIDENSLDPEKKEAFENEKELFGVTFVGSQSVDSGTTTLKGVSTKEDMIKKVCTRAIDNAIVRLQRNHDEFKVKTPLTQVDPLIADIGVKEGVTENTKFEVLEPYGGYKWKKQPTNGLELFSR
ncbi:MAG: hypothetical protein LIP01_08975 [Tannerellaceae bacterium]|nr:hypothetical protein [Tannerellaceae bacterium]